MNQIQQKKQKRNPTPKQRKAAQAVVENLLSKTPLPTGQVLEKVGYGTIVQDPQRITESEGFKTALAETGLKEALEAKGINPNKIADKINVLLNAVNKEGHDDYTAIDKGLKHATAIYGITEDKQSENKTTYNFLFSNEAQAQVAIINENIKRLLTNNPDA